MKCLCCLERPVFMDELCSACLAHCLQTPLEGESYYARAFRELLCRMNHRHFDALEEDGLVPLEHRQTQDARRARGVLSEARELDERFREACRCCE